MKEHGSRGRAVQVTDVSVVSETPQTSAMAWLNKPSSDASGPDDDEKDAMCGNGVNVRLVSPPVARKRVPRVEVRRVEVLKLTDFNEINRSFKANFFITWAFLDGARAEEADGLNAGGDGFPLDANGAPTFRPPAGWYVKQMEINNAIHCKMLDSVIFKQGEDLIANIRWEGVFHENFELYEFPFDNQGLTVSVSINCRFTGPLRVELSVAPDCSKTIDMSGYLEGDIWRIATDRQGCPMRLRPHLVGSDRERMFPTLSFTMLVRRKSNYFVMNAVLPFLCFSALSLAQLCVTASQESSLNHRAQLTMMLVLTCATYKMAISNKLPAISYLTFLDKYMLLCSLYVVLVAFESRSLAYIREEFGQDAIVDLDRVAFWIFAVAWLVLHAWFLLKSVQLHSGKVALTFFGEKDEDDTLASSIDAGLAVVVGRRKTLHDSNLALQVQHSSDVGEVEKARSRGISPEEQNNSSVA
eukprot:CAMPEP_0115864582 /NCGR_PEP_ID=MMETSP0287-20121206/19275_1 /TAXON_ID=412157 /ORGANISM="Chrysochromulina rotalis, Strain UIO044" /LENGTH=469 /DNA_ID=CAMNT_0003319057 /DNA_START=17 /DNA_END=1426 /DNA_ORIENTATION=-